MCDKKEIEVNVEKLLEVSSTFNIASGVDVEYTVELARIISALSDQLVVARNSIEEIASSTNIPKEKLEAILEFDDQLTLREYSGLMSYFGLEKFEQR